MRTKCAMTKRASAPRPVQTSEAKRRPLELDRQSAGRRRMRHRDRRHGFHMRGNRQGGCRNGGYGTTGNARGAMRGIGRWCLVRRPSMLMIATMRRPRRRDDMRMRGALMVIECHAHASDGRRHSLEGNRERHCQGNQPRELQKHILDCIVPSRFGFLDEIILN